MADNNQADNNQADNNQADDIQALGMYLTAVGQIIPRLPLLDPAAFNRPVLEELQRMKERMEQQATQMEQRLTQMDERATQSEQRATQSEQRMMSQFNQLNIRHINLKISIMNANIINRRPVFDRTQLYPLRHIQTGQVIANFPRTQLELLQINGTLLNPNLLEVSSN